MSIVSAIMGASTSGTARPKSWLVDWVHGGQESSAGVRVTPQSAMGLSAYYACIRNISEDIGKTPLKLYRNLGDRGKRALPNDPLYTLLHDAPNPEMSAMTFWEMLQSWELGWGSGYAEISRDVSDKPQALWPIHPSRVRPFRNDQGVKVFEVRNETGQSVDIAERNMFDLRGLGDDLRGFSVARIGCESIGRALAVQKHSSMFFQNGTTLSGVFTVDVKMGENEKETMRKSWPKGVKTAYNPMFLDQGMKWQPTAPNPEESQMLLTMDFTVLDMARWFRMPPHKIQHMVGAIKANIEQSAIEYITDALISHFKRIEQEVLRKLIRPGSRMFAEFLLNNLMRGDSKARSEFYTKRFMIGSASPNDIRRFENENPVPGGDVYYIPKNVAPVGDSGLAETVVGPDSRAARTVDESTRADVTAAMFGVFVGTAERLVRKETMALERAAKRHEAYVHFVEWADRFYAGHRDSIVDAFGPSGKAVLGLLGLQSDVETADRLAKFLEARASMWTTVDLERAKEAVQAGDLAVLCQDWSDQKPEEMALAILDGLASFTGEQDGNPNCN